MISDKDDTMVTEFGDARIPFTILDFVGAVVALWRRKNLIQMRKRQEL